MDFLIDILIPTYYRPEALAVTLTSLVAQSEKRFRIFISDQSETNPVFIRPEVNAVLNVLYSHGHPLVLSHHLPRQGMAEQRQFLFEQSSSPYVLYLDDDLILENFVIESMLKTIQREACGFVGSAAVGLSYIHDVRPQEQQIEFWEGPVKPEVVDPLSDSWQRHKLHNAANLFHLKQKIPVDPQNPWTYHVAWVGGCVLYDRASLVNVGAFSSWKEQPESHPGEDVLAQLRVMERYGGCGIFPSGAYYMELPTAVPDRNAASPHHFQPK